MLIPAFLAFYKYSNSSSAEGQEKGQALLTKLIHSYSQYQKKWEDRNVLHTKMVEQAADDRHLFFGSQGSHAVELRFPE